MRAKHILVAVIAAMALTGCASGKRSLTKSTEDTSAATAELGTVAPAYPIGELEPDVTVLERIPDRDLTVSRAAALDEADPCADIPDDVVAPAGVEVPPVHSGRPGCLYAGDLMLNINTYPPTPMAEEVADHRRYANGGTSDPLAHLAWLRIAGHYALERILKLDQTSGCWLSVDVGAPAAIFIMVARLDPTRANRPAPAREPPSTSSARSVARSPGTWCGTSTPRARPAG